LKNLSYSRHHRRLINDPIVKILGLGWINRGEVSLGSGWAEMSYVTATNRLLFSNQLFFATFILIAIAGLSLGESAALSASSRQSILSATAGLCVVVAFFALVLELLGRTEHLEAQAKQLAEVGEATARKRGAHSRFCADQLGLVLGDR